MAVTPLVARSVTPTLSVTGWVSAARASDARSASARTVAPAGSVSGRISANSSPPIRAKKSVRALRGARLAGDRAQGVVAGRVAERVVDPLEVVDVEDEESAVPAGAFGALELLLQAPLELPPVGRAGERVERGLRAQALDELEHLGAQRHDHRAGHADDRVDADEHRDPQPGLDEQGESDGARGEASATLTATSRGGRK